MGETQEQEEDKENTEKVSVFSWHYSRTRLTMKLGTQASIQRVFLIVPITDVFPGLSFSMILRAKVLVDTAVHGTLLKSVYPFLSSLCDRMPQPNASFFTG